MFQTVRDWWGSGRGKVSARLFVFELTVVIVGVFIAQAVTNWAQERGARDRMEASRLRTRRELADNFAYARVWQVAIPCLDSRMQDIMRAASVGPVDSALLIRPRFGTFVQTPMDEETVPLIRDRYGDSEVASLQSMRSEVAFAAADLASMVHAWGRLSLADSRLGKVSQESREQARIAASDIRAELRGLAFVVEEISRTAKRAGIRPRSDPPVRPARNCAEIWRKAETAFDV